jgi:hypothetical protein
VLASIQQSDFATKRMTEDGSGRFVTPGRELYEIACGRGQCVRRLEAL